MKHCVCKFCVRKHLLIENTGSDKYEYSDHGLFDARWGFLLSNAIRIGKNVLIFGAETNLMMLIDKKKKISGFLLKFLDGLDDTTFTFYWAKEEMLFFIMKSRVIYLLIPFVNIC